MDSEKFLVALFVVLGFLVSSMILPDLGDGATGLSIGEHHEDETGLVALWHCEAETILNDTGPNDMDGILYNVQYVDGQFRDGIYFDGTTSYVQVPYDSALIQTGNFTWEWWMKPDGTEKMLFYLEDYLYVEQADQDIKIKIWDGSWKETKGTGVLQYGVWQKITFQYIVNGVGDYETFLYRNEVEVANKQFSSPILGTSTYDLYIGCKYESGDVAKYFYTGGLDEIAIFSGTVAPDRVTDIVVIPTAYPIYENYTANFIVYTFNQFGLVDDYGDYIIYHDNGSGWVEIDSGEYLTMDGMAFIDYVFSDLGDYMVYVNVHEDIAVNDSFDFPLIPEEYGVCQETIIINNQTYINNTYVYNTTNVNQTFNNYTTVTYNETLLNITYQNQTLVNMTNLNQTYYDTDYYNTTNTNISYTNITNTTTIYQWDNDTFVTNNYTIDNSTTFMNYTINNYTFDNDTYNNFTWLNSTTIVTNIDNSTTFNDTYISNYLNQTWYNMSYVNDTYLSNTFQNWTWLNETFYNITNEYLTLNNYTNVTNEFLNQTIYNIANDYLNATYYNMTWLNQTFLDQTFLNQSWVNNTYNDNDYINITNVVNDYINQTFLNQSWINQSFYDSHDNYTWLSYNYTYFNTTTLQTFNNWLNQTFYNVTNDYLNETYYNDYFITNTFLNQSWVTNNFLNQTFLNQTFNYFNITYLNQTFNYYYYNVTYLNDTYVNVTNLTQVFNNQTYINNTCVTNQYVNYTTVNIQYNNVTWVNHTYVTNQFMNVTYQNVTYVNNTYVTYQNATYVNYTNTTNNFYDITYLNQTIYINNTYINVTNITIYQNMYTTPSMKGFVHTPLYTYSEVPFWTGFELFYSGVNYAYAKVELIDTFDDSLIDQQFMNMTVFDNETMRLDWEMILPRTSRNADLYTVRVTVYNVSNPIESNVIGTWERHIVSLGPFLESFRAGGIGDLEGDVVFKMSFKEGWNLVTLPFDVDGTSMQQFMSDFQPVSAIAQRLPDGQYEMYIDGTSDDALMFNGVGYFVYAEEDFIIDYYPEEAVLDFTLPLKEGWNMVGVPFGYARYLSDMPVTDISALVERDTYGHYHFYLICENDDVFMAYGRGYYIYSEIDQTITISY